MAASDKEVQRLLSVHKSLVFDESTQKIKCSLTNHEMPAKASAIENYVKGKKYKRLADLASLSYEDHKEHIVHNKKRENEMFCRLTLRHLEKTASAIQRHINGRKYKNALARWKECQKTGKKFVALNTRSAKRPKIAADDGGDDSTSVESESVQDEMLNDFESDDQEVAEEVEDMTDLYPPEDFKEQNADDDGHVEEDYDMEDEMKDENSSPSTEQSKARKSSNKDKKKDKSDNTSHRNSVKTGHKTKKKIKNVVNGSGDYKGKKRPIEINGKGKGPVMKKKKKK